MHILPQPHMLHIQQYQIATQLNPPIQVQCIFEYWGNGKCDHPLSFVYQILLTSLLPTAHKVSSHCLWIKLYTLLINYWLAVYALFIASKISMVQSTVQSHYIRIIIIINYSLDIM